MNDVRTRVDALLGDVTTRVGPDPGAAWVRGRRRRAARTVAVTAAVVALVGGAVAVTAGDPRPASPPTAGSPSSGVDEFPERVSDPWLVPDIDDAPEVLAGSLAGKDGIFGVAESGALYLIPQGDTTGDFQALVSDDGRKVAYLADATTFVVRDLATDEVVEYDGLGDNRSESRERYMTQGQAPGFWAPGGEHLVLWGWRNRPGSESEALVLDDTGGIDVIARPGDGRPVGWADPRHPLWLRHRAGVVDLVTTDLTGTVTAAVELDVPPGTGRTLDQWSGSASPDGLQLFVVTDRARFVLDARTGERLGQADLDGRGPLCSTSWRNDQPLEFAWSESGHALVAGLDRQPISVVEPSLEATCLHLTPHALAGGTSPTTAAALFGTGDAWLGWHLGEVGLALVAGGLLLGVVLWRRRTRG